jgi:hypothetical protein
MKAAPDFPGLAGVEIDRAQKFLIDRTWMIFLRDIFRL